MSAIAYLLLLSVQSSLVVLCLGAALAVGLWFALGLASFARQAREDR